jgi:putative hemolysin
MSAWFEIAIVLGLIIVNAFFAMAEMAVVNSRRIRLQQMADEGNRKAASALALAEDPGRLLSAVQVGITLIGIFAGAFGGATLGARLGGYLEEAVPAIASYAQSIAFGLVVVAITAVSIVVGELVPKRIALAQPEAIALRVARPLQIFIMVARPFVWLLERSTAAILAVLGVRTSTGQEVTEEEVKLAIAEGTEAGVIDAIEERMIHGVLALADRPVTALMTPRPDVYWIDLEDPPEVVGREIADCPYSRLVVARGGDLSNPVGVVQKKDLLNELITGKGLRIEALVRRPVYVPETVSCMRMLERFRAIPLHIAFVVDEYGDFVGLVTLTDVLAAIAGEIREEQDKPADELVRRADGSWLVDGRAAIDQVVSRLELRLEGGSGFHTAAGLALDRLARIPNEGDHFDVDGWRVEVVDMDGNRVDKLLFVPLQSADAPQAAK